MTISEKIRKKKEYLNIMEQIDTIKFIANGKWDWEHGLGHATRVASYTKEILLQLKAEKRIIDLGMAAALLHDIGLSKGQKVNHAIESGRMFENLLQDQNITKEELEIMKHAIEDHSNGLNIDSYIGVALTLADKLDVTYHRTENSSIQDYINKEIQKIRKVTIQLTNERMLIDYSTSSPFDFLIFKEWDKAITIPIKIANYLQRECIFTENQRQVKLSR